MGFDIALCFLLSGGEISRLEWWEGGADGEFWDGVEREWVEGREWGLVLVFLLGFVSGLFGCLRFWGWLIGIEGVVFRVVTGFWPLVLLVGWSIGIYFLVFGFLCLF